MSVVLSDAEIASLLAEPKPVPSDFASKISPKARHGHKGAEVSLNGDKGNRFAVLVRQSVVNHLDFSVILAYDVPGTSQRILLRRYNGKSHEHANALEKGPVFYDYHIHTATERYQKAGRKAEHFAEVTDRYADWRVALECLMDDCGIVLPPGERSLFPTI